ncbi:MAG: iron-sulfur cluster assembly scaffold protein [Candidatus Zixiibacteriota bacterium]
MSQAQIDSSGCAISIASSSMLAEVIEGMTLDEAIELGETIRGVMHGREDTEELDLGDLDALKGVRNFPVRVKCALLAWVALLGAIKDYREGRREGAITITTE